MSKSDNKSNKLISLCDYIPITLHQNVCVMLGPLISKYSNKLPIDKRDLDEALLINDKENQTTYFSPIREQYRPHLVNEKIITAQKMKIHKDLKYTQNIDSFPIEISNSTTSPENSSPLLKFFQYVQSPKFKGKSLMKTNRDLERNVNQLEHQLFITANSESELHETINDWKQRYRNLENDMKEAQSQLNLKDDLIAEKLLEIEKLNHCSALNKRLEEKMKDYQLKLDEIGFLNAELTKKCEENRVLKMENRESCHFKSLAIERRLQMENLTAELNKHKSAIVQLKETRIRLSETESQLVELQHHLHSLQHQGNADNSLSEASFNSSVFNPECLGSIVEMERDELRNELVQIKENTVAKALYESAKQQIDDLTYSINEYKTRSDQIVMEQNEIEKLCQLLLEDNSNIETDEYFQLSTIPIIIKLKTAFMKINDKLIFNEEHVIGLQNKISVYQTKEKELNCTVESEMKKSEQLYCCLIRVGDALFKHVENDINIETYIDDVVSAILIQKETLHCNEVIICNLKNNFRLLKESLSALRQFSKIQVDAFSEEMNQFEVSISDCNLKYIDYFNEKINEKSAEIVSLSEEIENLNSQKLALENEHIVNIRLMKDNHDKKCLEIKNEVLQQFEIIKNGIIEEYSKKEIDMKSDISKLIEDYQECLGNLETVSLEYEDKLIVKDEEMRMAQIQISDLEYNIVLLKQENEESKRKLEEQKIVEDQTRQENDRNSNFKLQALVVTKDEEIQTIRAKLNVSENEVVDLKTNIEEYSQKYEKLSMEKIKCEREMLINTENIQKLQNLIVEIKSEQQLISDELSNWKLIGKEFEGKYQQLLESSRKELDHFTTLTNDMQSQLLAKEDEINSIRGSHRDELDFLVLLNENKNKEISDLQCIIRDNKEDLMEKQQQIMTFQDTECLNQQIKQAASIELEELKNNYDKMQQSHSLTLQEKNAELKMIKVNFNDQNEVINRLQSELDSQKKELGRIENFHSLQILHIHQNRESQISELHGELSSKNEILNRYKISEEEKDQELCNLKEKIIELESLVEESTKALRETRTGYEHLQLVENSHQKLIHDFHDLQKTLEKSKLEFQDFTKLKLDEIVSLTCQLDHFQRREKLLESDQRENCARIVELKNEVVSCREVIKSLKDDGLKTKVQFDELMKEKDAFLLNISCEKNTIAALRDEISKLTECQQMGMLELSETHRQASILRQKLSEKDEEISTLKSSIQCFESQIIDLNRQLAACAVNKILHDNQVKNYQERLSELQSDHSFTKNSIADLNNVIEELRTKIRIQETNFEHLRRSSEANIEVLKSSVRDYKDQLEVINHEKAELVKDKVTQSEQLTIANESLLEFNNKIQNLESIIESEMANYEKVNEEFKQIEVESNQFREKYDKLMKQHYEEVSRYQATVEQLNSDIRKIEDERDDQIHEMEKLFNAKIFDLQQGLEDKCSEIESLKIEIIETRKTGKISRVALETEKERLQKALVTRENQFSEEKQQLLGSVDREREEKFKYKECFEETIHKLQNDIKLVEERANSEKQRMSGELSSLNTMVEEARLAGIRAAEEFKLKESALQKERDNLATRVEELEPLTHQIELLETKTRRLVARLTEVEKSDNVKELRRLRTEHKVDTQQLVVLEKENRQLSESRNALEAQVKSLLKDHNVIVTEKTQLEERLSAMQDQVHNLESMDQSRLHKISNIERESNSLKAENDSLKSRYLTLREISESHLERVSRTNEETVNSYIERLGALTKDVANFQEQIQLLTVKKNMLTQDNAALKRSVAELKAKLNSLKNVLREHTEYEMRQLTDKYNENNRYSRMSHWTNGPHLNRQLPPVDRLDAESASALGLSGQSRHRFESFVFSPYLCEDEASVCLTKQLPPATAANRPAVVNIRGCSSRSSDTAISTTTGVALTPLKERKHKDGIRQQITSKIRRSLHLDAVHSAGDSATKAKKAVNLPLPGTPTSNIKMAGKPPIAPAVSTKTLSSSQVKIIDLDELRNRQKNRRYTKKNQCSDSVNSVSSTTSLLTTANDRVPQLPMTGSICSLFEHGDGVLDNEESHYDPLEGSPISRKNLESDLKIAESPFTQRPKTPKPSSIIKRLIRKSKTKTPKIKQIEKTLSSK